MKSISKLKDEARKYEQREEWEKAIQAYLQVLRNADEGEAEVELPLYNRVGDLSVRLGKPQEAVRHYEQAADRYAEAGLYNNAIALCNKALRYSPDRLELIRKLGQFSASQGFITDARRYFLDYAERQFKAGKVSEALSALEDFANVAEDVEVREMLGRQLNAHGRTNDAVDELRRAYAMRVRDGDKEQAEILHAEILAIDPKADIAGGATAPPDSTRAAASQALPGLVELERPETELFTVESPTDSSTTGEIEGLERGALAEDVDVDAIELTGFEATGQSEFDDIDLSGGDDIEGLETTTLDFDAVDPDAPTAGDLGLDREEISFGDADGARNGEDFDLPILDAPGPVTDLPGPAGAEARHAVDGEAFDLPLLEDETPDEEATPLPPPEIDGKAPLDLPGTGGQPNFDLGGDLPLDLTSLGGPGTSPFDLPPLEDTGDTPEWKDEADSFDLPEIDTESLDLPTWEPEPDATFELPKFETEMEVEDSADETGAETDDSSFAFDETIEAEPHVDPAVAETNRAEAEPAGLEDAGPEAAEAEPGPASGRPAHAEREPAAAGEGTSAAAAPETSLPDLESAHPDAQQAAGLEPDSALETADVEPDAADASVDSAEAVSGTAPHDAGDDDRPARVLDVPAIELPTWESGQLSGLADDVPEEAFDEQESETAEPAWVDATQIEEDDESPDLPTFTYEDEDASSEPTEAVDTDWLDFIADDPVEEEPAGLPVEDGGAADTIAAGVENAAGPVEPADRAVRDAAAKRARDDEAAAETAASAAAPARKDEGFIDLGALVAEDEKAESTRFRVQETAPTGDEDRDFAELLSQFKSKVQEHLPAEDAAAHYDLGLAFKEMGLIDEAIGEFQVAMRAGHMRLKVYEELGQCFLQKEQFNIAQKVLTRALDMKFEDELELLGVYYHLGRAYEALGKRDEARDAYERVLGMDISFGDVTERLARL